MNCYLLSCALLNVLSIFTLLLHLWIVPCILVKRIDKGRKKWVILHLFIEHHYKSIVAIIRERHILTLHLSTANWRIKLTTGCCCKNAASRYAIYFCLVESIPQFLELWPILMHFHGPSNFTLLYRNATSYGINVCLWFFHCHRWNPLGTKSLFWE